MTLFDLMIENSTIKLNCIKMFVNAALVKLELEFCDYLIKERQRCYYKSNTVLPFRIYRIIKVIVEELCVVSSRYCFLYCQFYCQ